MDKLISLEDFHRLYPVGTRISSGSYGEVFTSNFENVVKIQRTTYNDVGVSLREVNVYSRFIHPCIIPLLNYTFQFETETITFFFAFPRGASFKDAVKRSSIPIEDMKLDILSALHHLHQGGIAHCDIKPDNLVLFNGHINLIDFGLSKPIIETNRGKMITGVGYSLWYRDPQYNEGQYNSIKVELYSAGKIFYNLEKENNRDLNIIAEEIADPFVIETTKRLEWRSSLNDLIENPIPGIINEPAPIDLKFCDDTIIKKIFPILINKKLKDFPIEIIFYIVHLFHRSYPYLSEIHPFTDILNVCGYLTLTIRGYDSDHFITNLKYVVMMDVLIVLQGIIITPTTWNYLSNVGPIYSVIKDLFSCHYSYPMFRLFDDERMFQKNLYVDDLLRNPYYLNDDFKGEVIFNPTIEAIDIFPSPFDFDVVIELLSKLEKASIEREQENLFYQLQASILYYASELPNLNVRVGVSLFNMMKASKYKRTRYLLQWYFGEKLYDKLPEQINRYSVNPFAIRSIGELDSYQLL